MKGFALLALCVACQGADVAGHYVLQGVREVGSELLLRPDGGFEYMLAYGAADYAARGKWKKDGNVVVLTSDIPAAKPFRLVSSEKATHDDVRIRVQGAGGQPVPHIEAMLGKTEGTTDNDGVAIYPSATARKNVVFRIPVYQFQSEPLPLNESHNSFVFEINGEAITTVPFKAERLAIRDGNLELRYWDRDHVMVYRKQ